MTDREIAALEVLDGGLLTTVQDLGRPESEPLGLARGGALDAAALVVANLLAGNPRGAAALEATIAGPTLRVRRALTLGVAGADLGLVIEPGARPVVPPAAIRLRAGDVLSVTGVRAGGARVYLAPTGGIEVPVVLGSRSTVLGAAFGGLDGRPLRVGDVLNVGLVAEGAGVDALIPVPGPRAVSSGPIRVRPGPHTRWGGVSALAALLATDWLVSPDADRRGLRLRGPVLPGSRAAGPSHGVVPGTIQVTPDGTPLVLLADAGPTGGYPVVAIVIRADLDALGQLRPGERLRFEVVGARAAMAAERSRRMALDAFEARLGRSRPPSTTDAWDDLAGVAGG